MASKKARQSIAGSELAAMPGAKAGAATDPNERIEVTLHVRPRSSDDEIEARIQDLASKLPKDRRYLTRDELEARHGASPEDFAKVEAFARDHHLSIVESSKAKRTVKLAGTARDLGDAFGVELRHFSSSRVSYRGKVGPTSVPADLAGIVEHVIGLDNRPVATPRYRVLGAGAAGKLPSTGRRAAPKPATRSNGKTRTSRRVTAKAAKDTSLSVPEIARLYDFPTGLDGTNQCIGLIELNTPRDPSNPTKNIGTGFSQSDLTQFFKGIKLNVPDVTSVAVDGGGNLPGINPDADGEVTLDVEVAGAIAPGAKIAVYFAPNTAKGFTDAVAAAVHDTQRKPSVISISWGGPEDAPYSSKALRDGLTRAFQDAALLGITVCVAAGDSGSSDLPQSDGQPHVDFPSSSPLVLSCGGTTLTATGTAIADEVVWNGGRDDGASGGGVSNVYGPPTYQAKSNVPKSPKGKAGRGVPDIAGVADPATGYEIVLAGKGITIGGTSAVAPLWAGLIALFNQSLIGGGSKAVGPLNTLLYGQLVSCLRDITEGNNDIDGDLGKYSAKSGWDACTGLGSPDGKKLLQALGGHAPAHAATRKPVREPAFAGS